VVRARGVAATAPPTAIARAVHVSAVRCDMKRVKAVRGTRLYQIFAIPPFSATDFISSSWNKKNLSVILYVFLDV
jgi:hypothetical protein